MEFDRATSEGYLANHMARLFEAALRRAIEPLGLKPGQFPVLLELDVEDGLTQKALVTRLGVEQATMANTLARMERDGLVVRRPHPDDDRARMVFLTAAAREALGPAKVAAAEINARAMDGLDAATRAGLVAGMAHVIARLSGE